MKGGREGREGWVGGPLCEILNTPLAGGRHNVPRPCKLTFDFLTLKVVSESRVTWATSVPILVFLWLSVLDLGPMYATNTDVRRQTETSDAHHRLTPLQGGA